MNDEAALIRKFCSVTNTSHEVAVNYLMVSDGNVEQAISLYLESGGADLSDAFGAALTSTSPQLSPSRATSTDTGKTSTFDSDAELAKAIAQEDSTIRPPIAPKRDILVGDQDNGRDGGMIRRDVPRTRRSRDYTHRNFAGDVIPHRIVPSEATRLADLFSPPFDIIHKENFEKTRIRARNDGKWLMVDIQNIKEFSSQLLNRDLWTDKTVKDVIRAHFLFLQYNSDSPDGQQYINFYPIENYPHIAIIDPRTGERVKVWSTQTEPTEFLIGVTDFLERYSLTDPMKPTSTPKKALSEMSEEEQLRAAMEESLNYNNKNVEVQTSKQIDFESESDDDMEIEDVIEVDSIPEEHVSTFDTIQPVEREEAQGPTSAMIKFRLADGQTIIRRFEKLDPVRYLFEFIKATVPNLKNQQFELVCHRNNLINHVDETVEAAGLSNSLVNVNNS
ncbi:15160_t:CDS:10 [Funneliformis mosseae]|uniref:15160_t:CDS:1 n=1 Tax=Funneliformis mosseae TaxID=27381 RepID=A0A9N9GPF5_FUNMO|nr:15160_t:CDS:10 [Funneliformis mosseae]